MKEISEVVRRKKVYRLDYDEVKKGTFVDLIKPNENELFEFSFKNGYFIITYYNINKGGENNGRDAELRKNSGKR